MTDRPILDIPLDTSAFDAFRAKFDDYRAKAAETPSAWADVGKTTQTTAQSFDKMAAALARMQAALAGIEQSVESAGEEQAVASDRWTNIASSARVFGSNVKDASLSLAKWSGLTGLFAGILSAGGLWGISRMAAGVGSRRSQAMSYGMGYGEFQSYQTNFARLGNAGGLLAGFTNAMTSAENRSPLYALMGPDADKRLAGKSPGAALAEALPDIKRLVDNTDPRNLEGVLRATGADRLGLDVNTALVFQRSSPEDLAQLSRDFAGDQPGMALSFELAQNWQDFSTALDLAGAEIENHFATNLVNLAPGLTRLADATSDLVDHMLKDGGPAEKGMERVGKGITWFADNVGSKWTLSKLDTVVKDAGIIADLVARITKTPLADAIGLGRDLAETGADLANSLTGQPRQYDKTPSHFHPRWGRIIEGAFGLNHEDYVARGPDGSTKRLGMGSSGAGGGGSTPEAVPQNADQSTWGPAGAVNSAISKLGENRYQDRADLAEYMRTGGHGMDPARAAWCAAFVGASLEKAGLPSIPASQGGNIATSYMRWGDAADSSNPEKGDVLVENRGRGPGQVGGHVGLATGDRDAGGRVGMVSGNHSGAVRFSWEDPRRIIARRAHIENPGDPEGKLIPVRPVHPHMQGQTNTVHVDDETGYADVKKDSRAVGPLSYGTDFGRFLH